ncbi:LAMI_0B05226g1_1 [Lachancea mirantina]|uniref:LAMI_0B05226g1_1 n=1 Tax=Lachancea mirantina TaxID=1230905 RepID=A0A1G4IVU2_9SACH|nr:LAMI_0B05226g1_1 [Lachancea mirantina]
MKSREKLYENHINMYPPGFSGKFESEQPKLAPYPVEDTREVINPVPLKSREGGSSSSSTPSQTSFKVTSPNSARYGLAFAYAGPKSTDSLNARPAAQFSSLNSSVDTFESASDVQIPPPPYEDDQTQRFLEQKVYRRPEDLIATTTTTTSTTSSTTSTGSTRPSPKKPAEPDLSTYSKEALEFRSAYETAIGDGTNFTATTQLKWCETLLTYAFKPEFISNYNINAAKLKRELTAAEVQKNRKIILEHALKVLTKLISLEHPPALYLMGTLYSHQPYLDMDVKSILGRNDAKALDYYVRAAKLRHAEACYRAGASYEYQRGTAPELSREECVKHAVDFYEMGAKVSDDGKCMYKLGMLALAAINPHNAREQKVIDAIRWFNEASSKVLGAKASPQALYELAKIYEFEGLPAPVQASLAAAGFSRDATKALACYHRCATALEYPLAQWKLGFCYEFGELNLPVVANKSIAWYAKAAMASPRGNPIAMMALSGWYLTGATGVLQPNNQEAFKWASKACTASDGKLARAEYALGFYLENAIGCERDMEAARVHYHRAAQSGHRKAQERLNKGDL